MNPKIIAVVVIVIVGGYLLVFKSGAPLAKYNPLHSQTVSSVTHTGHTGGGSTGGESENDGGKG